ncbi:sensor histidine kinase [Oxalobacter paraformigenes]|uniref:histidine kinase n=1 Tax=Oxalobacter paraformigenes TaxID=556268 RepID=C3X5B7_9BURK|nr:ATP-binding protein [Oxalobacter paraformigenes]EEO28403.1 hypothetical protein OFAG_01556 [Oxalobacter paraformigenes]
MTRVLRYLWIVGGAIMSILLFLLASASENTDFFDKNYSWLVGVNILVAFALLILVVWMLIRLVNRYRRGKFGSKLMTKLVVLFALMGILPGAIIYVVSVQFVSRSIESWFDVRVESALDSGVKLAQSVLETSKEELTLQASHLANELAVLPLSEQTILLTRFRNEKDGIEAVIVNNKGHLIAASGTANTSLLPDLPTVAMLRQVHMMSHYAAIEGEIDDPSTADLQEADLLIRVIVAIPAHNLSISLQNEPYYLQLLQKMPENVANNAEALRAAYSEYQIRSLSRSGLRKIYIVTLSLTLLLAIFGAIASAFQIASNLARPLLLLAQGTKAVSEGNLSPRPIVSSSDELGTLTQSFNAMTHQLAEARAQAEKSRADLEAAKVYLESVLANMSAGVIVLDHEFKLVGFNDPVTRILRHDLTPLIGRELSKIDGLSVFGDAITKAFSQLSAQAAANNRSDDLHWQQQIEIPHDPDTANESAITLLARGSSHLVNHENRYIVVFDDITEVISAQRSIAWGEVARRLAHEIKNPLTPIQLSAERLQMKLHDKLSEQDAAILKKSTDTIVNQVTSMKQMVNDFRNFAKTPPAFLKPLDLNALAEDIVHLYAGGDSHEIIHTRLADNLPKIMGDETQLRQVIHNLLQNAQDAVGEIQNGVPYTPCIELITEKVHYQDASGQICIAVRLSVMDNGPGFAQKILSRIFEPYITTKERGTGLGMAMVKKIIDEHGGRIDVQNRSDTNGAKVSILFLQLALPEMDEALS